MQTTVIVKLTGLLMLSPGPGAHAPTYALFPVEPGHFAQIGFRQSRKTADCRSYDQQHGICYVDITNRSVQLGRRGNGTPINVPSGNVTQVGHRPVNAGHFDEAAAPGTLKARVVFHEAELGPTCSIGLYSFSGSSGVKLPNVVELRYLHPRSDTLQLTAKSLRTGTTDAHWFLQPDLNGQIELFIRHLPPGEMDTSTFPPLPDRPTEAKHYRSYYTLLGDSPESVENPIFQAPNPEVPTHVCIWARQAIFGGRGEVLGFRDDEPRSVGTLTCTVGRGDPTYP